MLQLSVNAFALRCLEKLMSEHRQAKLALSDWNNPYNFLTA